MGTQGTEPFCKAKGIVIWTKRQPIEFEKKTFMSSTYDREQLSEKNSRKKISKIWKIQLKLRHRSSRKISIEEYQMAGKHFEMFQHH